MSAAPASSPGCADSTAHSRIEESLRASFQNSSAMAPVSALAVVRQAAALPARRLRELMPRRHPASAMLPRPPIPAIVQESRFRQALFPKEAGWSGCYREERRAPETTGHGREPKPEESTAASKVCPNRCWHSSVRQDLWVVVRTCPSLHFGMPFVVWREGLRELSITDFNRVREPVDTHARRRENPTP